MTIKPAALTEKADLGWVVVCPLCPWRSKCVPHATESKNPTPLGLAYQEYREHDCKPVDRWAPHTD